MHQRFQILNFILNISRKLDTNFSKRRNILHFKIFCDKNTDYYFQQTTMISCEQENIKNLKKLAEKKKWRENIRKKWPENDLSPDQLGNIPWIYSILNLKYSNHLIKIIFRKILRD